MRKPLPTKPKLACVASRQGTARLSFRKARARSVESCLVQVWNRGVFKAIGLLLHVEFFFLTGHTMRARSILALLLALLLEIAMLLPCQSQPVFDLDLSSPATVYNDLNFGDVREINFTVSGPNIERFGARSTFTLEVALTPAQKSLKDSQRLLTRSFPAIIYCLPANSFEMRAAVTFTLLPVAFFLGILFKSSGSNHLLALLRISVQTLSPCAISSHFCRSEDRRSICIPLASFATNPLHKNQRACQCSPHVNQCGSPGKPSQCRYCAHSNETTAPLQNSNAILMHFLEWSSYPFLNSNLPSTVCTFYPYEDFSQQQPRRVSMSLFDTSTPRSFIHSAHVCVAASHI
jgi:hypothetical protein